MVYISEEEGIFLLEWFKVEKNATQLQQFATIRPNQKAPIMIQKRLVKIFNCILFSSFLNIFPKGKTTQLKIS